MKRRDLIAGMALTAAGAQGQHPESGSLYIPQAQRVEDRALLHDFMDEYPFVDLVTAAPSIRITHIPVMLDRTAGPYGTLFGHVARNNPQHETFDGRQSAVIVFRGPHAYISPAWYANRQSVPTWNFAVVHVTGKPKPITDKKIFHDKLAGLVRKFENRYDDSAYDLLSLPDSYTYPMIDGIAGFEIEIDEIEGKFKLGQERSAVDRASILKHLASEKPDPSMRDFTAGFYDKLGASQRR
jgi:transcriptional regulator